MPSLRTLLLAVAPGLLVASPCWGATDGATPTYPACQREPTEADVAAAKQAFSAGEQAFHEADYEQAIVFWEHAFRKDCTAIALLLNLARAYELAREYAKGRAALEAFLEKSPDDPERTAIERRIEHLREMEREEATLPPPPSGAEVSPERASRESPIPKETPPAEPPRSPATVPLWPIVVTGAGIVTTGVGLALLIPGQVSLSDYTGRYCSNKSEAGVFQCLPEVQDGQEVRSGEQVTADANSAKASRDLGIVVTSVGAATAVVGAVFWYLGATRKEEAAAFHPWVGPGEAGFSYSGVF